MLGVNIQLMLCSTPDRGVALEPGTVEHLRACAEIFGVGQHAVRRDTLCEAVVSAALQILMQPIGGSVHEAVRALAYHAYATYCGDDSHR